MKSPERTTRVSRLIAAPPSEVYRAFVNPDLVARWLAPGTMECTVHTFEARDGGHFRMSLRYTDPEDGPGGKTTEDTDTFEGRFVELVPDERIVWVVTFESNQPEMAGDMRLTWTMMPAGDRTEVTVVCEDIPPGIRLEDNEEGSSSSLAHLARLVEGGG